MQRFKVIILLLTTVLLFNCTYTVVPPGEEGILVELTGGNRGVEDYPIKTGRVWYNSVNEDVIKYPTYQIENKWTMNPMEGSKNNEEISFSSTEGSEIRWDIGLTFKVREGSTPRIYVQHKKDLDEIADGYIRNRVRDSFSQRAAGMEVMNIVGPGKNVLRDSVLYDLRQELEPLGFEIIALSYIGAPRVPPNVTTSIDNVIKQVNAAKEAEEKVKEATAKANQKIETARGDAESIKIAVDAEAYRITTAANAKAKANTTINRSLTSALIQFEATMKWNGVLPTVTSGATPFIQVPTKK